MHMQAQWSVAQEQCVFQSCSCPAPLTVAFALLQLLGCPSSCKLLACCTSLRFHLLTTPCQKSPCSTSGPEALVLLLLLPAVSGSSQVFLGCFKDPGPAGLPDLLFRGGSSAAECGAWARRAGNRVWGLTGAGSSRECRAGWNLAAAVAGGPAGGGCGAPCKEGTSRCGGAGSVGLWRANSQ